MEKTKTFGRTFQTGVIRDITQFCVHRMDSPLEARKVRKALLRLDTIEDVDAEIEDSRLLIRWKREPDISGAIRMMQKAGFEASECQHPVGMSHK